MNPMTFLSVGTKSLWSRRGTVLLTLLSVALSVTLFIGIEKISRTAKDSFSATVSGTDMIVGARSGPINLLLYSVFRVGDPTGSMSWDAYEALADRPEVEWTIPLSLGDSHGGFRVLGTTKAYLDHYRYGSDRALTLAQGEWTQTPTGAVLGAAAAVSLGYELGDTFAISHGIVSVGFANHDQHDFEVVGILAPTGTPVDRTIHVDLSGIEAAHSEASAFGIAAPAQPPTSAPEGDGAHDHDEHQYDEQEDGHEERHGHDTEHPSEHAHGTMEPETISAFMVGLKNRTAVLIFQRTVNTYKDEPLTAIIPGIALTQLWSVVGNVEKAFFAIGGLAVVIGLLTLLITILTGLNQRAREIAVLRAAGAGGGDIFGLLMVETGIIAALGAGLGLGLVYGGLGVLGPMLERSYGIPMVGLSPGPYDLIAVLGVIGAALLVGAIPAFRAYRTALADGLTVKF